MLRKSPWSYGIYRIERTFGAFRRPFKRNALCSGVGAARRPQRRNLLGGLSRCLDAIVSRAVVLLLGDARGLAAQTAQVIELGAAHLAAAYDLDRVDHRRIERKDALHALAIGDLADGEVLIEAGARPSDADALIGLDAGALALHHLDVDQHRIARAKIRNLLAGRKLCDLLLFELLNQIHGNYPSAAPIWKARGLFGCPGRAS